MNIKHALFGIQVFEVFLLVLSHFCDPLQHLVTLRVKVFRLMRVVMADEGLI